MVGIGIEGWNGGDRGKEQEFFLLFCMVWMLLALLFWYVFCRGVLWISGFCVSIVPRPQSFPYNILKWIYMKQLNNQV
jgi:hypothetical protein